MIVMKTPQNTLLENAEMHMQNGWDKYALMPQHKREKLMMKTAGAALLSGMAVSPIILAAGAFACPLFPLAVMVGGVTYFFHAANQYTEGMFFSDALSNPYEYSSRLTNARFIEAAKNQYPNSTCENVVVVAREVFRIALCS